MKICKVRNVNLPTRGNPDKDGLGVSRSAGIDFYLPNDRTVEIGPGDDALIPSGIVAEIPEGYMMMMADKSGRATRNKLMVGAKIIDEDYEGEIHLHVFNLGETEVTLYPGEKVCQGILVPVAYEDIEIVEDRKLLHVGRKSQRGTGGFGSTGLSSEKQ